MLIIKKNKKEKGVSILLMVLIMSIILSIGLGISAISVQQSRLLISIGHSIVAFYAADSGTEHQLFDMYKVIDVNPDSVSDDYVVQSTIDLNYKVTTRKSVNNTSNLYPTITSVNNDPKFGTCDSINFCIKSTGTYKKTKRGIETKY